MDVSELADVSVELEVIGDVDDVSYVLVKEDRVLDVSVALTVVSVVPREVVFVVLMVSLANVRYHFVHDNSRKDVLVTSVISHRYKYDVTYLFCLILLLYDF